jgi:hypothetical protein
MGMVKLVVGRIASVEITGRCDTKTAVEEGFHYAFVKTKGV